MYLMCPSAGRLHLSSFDDFPHNKHLIDFPSSESLTSVFNSFRRSISDNLLGSWLLVTFWRFLEWLGITVCVGSLDTPSFELLLLDEADCNILKPGCLLHTSHEHVIQSIPLASIGRIHYSWWLSRHNRQFASQDFSSFTIKMLTEPFSTERYAVSLSKG